MARELQMIYLARHGETAWSITGQHTGLTDLPLTERGELVARRLGERLRGLALARVFTSPLQRARRTCELAGVPVQSAADEQQSAGRLMAEIDLDLVEWNYGAYEGRRTVEIRAERPDWQLFRDGCPGGETPEQISARADRVVSRLRAIAGNVLIFSSGHILRVLAGRWLGLEPDVSSRYFMLSTGGLCAPGYENDLARPVIRLWNETEHPGP